MERDYWQADRDKGLMMIWINIDEGPEKAKEFRDRHHLTTPVLVADGTTDRRFEAHRYSIPYTVVVDPHIVIRFSGATWSTNDFNHVVAALLSEAGSGKSSGAASL